MQRKKGNQDIYPSVPTGTTDKVWASVEMTINLGDYNNVKLQVGQSLSYDVIKDSPEKIRVDLLDELFKDAMAQRVLIRDDFDLD